MTFPTLEDIVKAVETHHDPDFRSRLCAMFLWGSRVYGTQTPTSDYDLIAVTTTANNVFTAPSVNWGLYEYWENDVFNVTFFRHRYVLQTRVRAPAGDLGVFVFAVGVRFPATARCAVA
eukprot:PhM_4_TR8802/c0_g1_i1/m.48305